MNALIKGGEAPDGTLKQWPASFNAGKLALTPRRRYRRGIGMMKRQDAELVERLDFGCREGAIVDADVVETAGTIMRASIPARSRQTSRRALLTVTLPKTAEGQTAEKKIAVKIMVDRTLPSEGAADDDNLILNPDMLKDQPATVRIFIFKHECGHLTVGDSELVADCFAVHQGVREQWLDRKGLGQVCESFGGDPRNRHPPVNVVVATSIS